MNKEVHPKNKMKCPRLDEAGISVAETGIYTGFDDVSLKDSRIIQICLECDLDECVYVTRDKELGNYG